MADYERAMVTDDDDMRWVYHLSLGMLGREAEAIERYRNIEKTLLPGIERWIVPMYRAGFEGKRDECIAALREIEASRFRDPEGFFIHAHALAHTGEVDLVIEMLDSAASRGFYCPRFLATDPWLERVRADARFAPILARAREGARAAAEAYTAAGGQSLLGVAALADPQTPG